MILKGFFDRFKNVTNDEIQNVTVTPVGDKIAIDVNVLAGGSGGGGGSADSTAANQALQIAEAEETNANLIDIENAVDALLETPVHTHFRLTYVAAGNGAGEVETIRYYTGGTGAEVLAETRTFSYDASNRVTLMEKS